MKQIKIGSTLSEIAEIATMSINDPTLIIKGEYRDGLMVLVLYSNE